MKHRLFHFIAHNQFVLFDNEWENRDPNILNGSIYLTNIN